jgi:hypothetical protein
MARKRKTQKVLLGGVLEFSKAYPALTDAVLTYEEFDFRGLVRDGVHSVRRHGHVVGCSNSLCHEGGYDLRPEIEKLMSRGETRPKVVHLQCDGWETWPRHGPVGDVCTRSIEGTLQLKMRGGDIKP